ncbi:MAG TPA: hypothetical protein VH639_15185 [Bryobacteraceae bacterium]|jgi:hypothetical protein
MPRISDLLAAMQKIESTGSLNDKKLLEELWNQIGAPKGKANTAPDADFEGDSNDVRDFVGWFKTLVSRQKATPKTAERVQALELIESDFIGKPTPTGFPSINADKFAFQLALRVREPRLINQKNTNLCGPNSLLIQLAKDRPLQYVCLAIQLFREGKSTLDRMEVEPGVLIRSFYNKEALGECDYVVLGSVRDSAAILLGDGMVRNVGLLTKPGVLCEWLRKSGYSEVEDHTFFEVPGYVKPVDLMTHGTINAPRPTGFQTPSNPNEKIANLKEAANKLAAGKRIIMNAEAQLSQEVTASSKRDRTTNSGLTGPSNAMTTHWCWVSKLNVDEKAGKVQQIKIYTWGGSFSAASLDLNDFVSRYSGFVSYDDGLITPAGTR